MLSKAALAQVVIDAHDQVNRTAKSIRYGCSVLGSRFVRIEILEITEEIYLIFVGLNFSAFAPNEADWELRLLGSEHIAAPFNAKLTGALRRKASQRSDAARRPCRTKCYDSRRG